MKPSSLTTTGFLSNEDSDDSGGRAPTVHKGCHGLPRYRPDNRASRRATVTSPDPPAAHQRRSDEFKRRSNDSPAGGISGYDPAETRNHSGGYGFRRG